MKKFLLIFIIIATIGSVSVLFTMDKSKNINKNHNVVIIGNSNHGKTLLMSAITKLYDNYTSYEQINQLEEKDKNGLFSYTVNNKNYTLYDVKDHNTFKNIFKNNILTIDGAILVVAATDGVMTETVEQLKIIAKQEVKNIVVYISKCDEADDVELQQLVENQVRNILTKNGYDGKNIKVFKGSSLKAIENDSRELDCIKNLLEEVEKSL